MPSLPTVPQDRERDDRGGKSEGVRVGTGRGGTGVEDGVLVEGEEGDRGDKRKGKSAGLESFLRPFRQ